MCTEKVLSRTFRTQQPNRVAVVVVVVVGGGGDGGDGDGVLQMVCWPLCPNQYTCTVIGRRGDGGLIAHGLQCLNALLNTVCMIHTV